MNVLKSLSFLPTLILTLCLVPASALARGEVYLNGVKITGQISNEEFSNAKLRFDDKGDLYITAENVRVYEEGKGATGQRAAMPRDTYWLVATQTEAGMTQYDIEVHVNGKLVTRVQNKTAQSIIDAGPFLKPGENTISFTAIKDLSKTRRSFSDTHQFEVFLGKGTQSPDGLVIGETYARYTRSAQDVENHSSSFTFMIK